VSYCLPKVYRESPEGQALLRKIEKMIADKQLLRRSSTYTPTWNKRTKEEIAAALGDPLRKPDLFGADTSGWL
jgi:hypothetical protein